MTYVCSFVDHNIFIRHFGHGVGHQKDRWQQEADTATEIEADSEGNNNNIEELDEHEEEINEDEESEGEELASESNNNDGSNDGCNSNNLGYASFQLAARNNGNNIGVAAYYIIYYILPIQCAFPSTPKTNV